jgi:cytochrome c oxidase assembly protein subunit 15
MMITGAFVAGLKAGHIYNTFPLMGEGLIPKSVLSITPAWRNLFENPATVQFVHRGIAYLILISVLVLFIRGRKLVANRNDINIGTNLIVLLVIMLCQVSFGIITLLNKVPVFWGVLHQFTGVALLTSALFLAHRLSRDY